MEKNYLFQNYGYVDKPVNFKHVVVDLLRRYGIFIHMRDEPSGIYDLNKFLYETNPMGIPYHQDNIKRAEKAITTHQQRLKDLEENGDQLYQQYYDEGKVKLANEIYAMLQKEGIGVILDDRENINIGAKIKDCKVLGTPNILVIGDRTDGENLEIENSKTGEKTQIKKKEIVEALRKC